MKMLRCAARRLVSPYLRGSSTSLGKFCLASVKIVKAPSITVFYFFQIVHLLRLIFARTNQYKYRLVGLSTEHRANFPDIFVGVARWLGSPD